MPVQLDSFLPTAAMTPTHWYATLYYAAMQKAPFATVFNPQSGKSYKLVFLKILFKHVTVTSERNTGDRISGFVRLLMTQISCQKVCILMPNMSYKRGKICSNFNRSSLYSISKSISGVKCGLLPLLLAS